MTTDTDTPDQTYDEFWKDLVETDGQLDPAKVKLELHDYHVLLTEVPRAYNSLTRGRISKPHTLASEVIRVVGELAEDDRSALLAALRGMTIEVVDVDEVMIETEAIASPHQPHTWPLYREDGLWRHLPSGTDGSLSEQLAGIIECYVS